MKIEARRHGPVCIVEFTGELKRGTPTELLRAESKRLVAEGESQAAARGYIDPDILRHHYEAFLDGQQSARFLWATLSLEMWLRQQESSYTAT